MIIEHKNGGYLIYEIVKGYLFQRFYMGYTRRQAVKNFNADKKEENQ